jgi:hypothetical protein
MFFRAGCLPRLGRYEMLPWYFYINCLLPRPLCSCIFPGGLCVGSYKKALSGTEEEPSGTSLEMLLRS